MHGSWGVRKSGWLDASLLVIEPLGFMWLVKCKGFILVSHDRDLLDACTDHCLVLNRKSIEVQNGNFSCWWENKEKKDSYALAENEKHKKEIGKLKVAAAQSKVIFQVEAITFHI